MIILPAIDLHEGQCVRLLKGDYATAEVVAGNAVEAAQQFEEQGAHWMHMVDLDGAKDGKPRNAGLIFDVVSQVGLHVEVGGGIRDMETVEFYLEHGVSRIILGSAALNSPEFVREAVKKHGKKIAIGIDALQGKVAAEGWISQSDVDYIELAKRMEDMGVTYLICTDISKDGMLNGPNLTMLDRLNRTVSCNIIASGGISSIMDIVNLYDLGLYGAIAGKSLYTGALDLRTAIVACQKISNKSRKNEIGLNDELERYFKKSDLIPAIIQEESTGQVLMMAYMNRESLAKSMETGYTWFYSRSRGALWNKGETSGHTQKIINIHADCDDDTLLIRVHQKGPACHTGSQSCFFKKLL